jgi:NAD(P)-dependent dehydrogenase (short-subunit alcohol dehydrogenase family)
MGQVQDKVAIVTGGASGIGAACADLLAREGANVVITDLDDRGAATADDIRRSGGQAVYHHHDVTDEAGWPAVIAAAERFGRLGILVANAGIFVRGQITDISLADWRRSRQAHRAAGIVRRFRSDVRDRRAEAVIRSPAGAIRDPAFRCAPCGLQGRRDYGCQPGSQYRFGTG